MNKKTIIPLCLYILASSHSAYGATRLTIDQVREIMDTNMKQEAIEQDQALRNSLEQQLLHSIIPPQVIDKFKNNILNFTFNIDKLDYLHNVSLDIIKAYKGIALDFSFSFPTENLPREGVYKDIVYHLTDNLYVRLSLMHCYYIDQAEEYVASRHYIQARDFYKKAVRQLKKSFHLRERDLDANFTFMVISNTLFNSVQKTIKEILEVEIVNPSLIEAEDRANQRDYAAELYKTLARVRRAHPFWYINDVLNLATYNFKKMRYNEALYYISEFLRLVMSDERIVDLPSPITYYEALRIMAHCYWRLGKHDLSRDVANKVLREADSNIYKANGVFNIYLALADAKVGKWLTSLKYFEEFCKAEAHWKGQNILNEEDNILIVELLLNTSRINDKHDKSISQLLASDNNSTLAQELAYVKARIKANKKEKYLQTLKQRYLAPFADLLYAEAKNIFTGLEQEYQKLWDKLSLINLHNLEDKFKKVDAYFNEAHELYQSLQNLKDQQDYRTKMALLRVRLGELKLLRIRFQAEALIVSSHFKIKRKKTIGLEGVELPGLTTISQNDARINDREIREIVEHQKAEWEQQKLLRQEERRKARFELQQQYLKTLEYLKGSQAPLQPTRAPQIPALKTIKSFSGKLAKQVWLTRDCGEVPFSVHQMLQALNEAKSTYQLKYLLTPGTKLEILKGERKGQLSLRINDVYRLCFQWMSGEGAYGVEITQHYKTL
ncbi:type II toxin-antitoxin system RelE/ParE family toxin [Candidatus Odyssella thessalonicensis]|uniref:type II toxin-antitoxin system RelE/ParE family toxin n=1 Tax=Candidatus Odyssella thessalonicensis TaxID=84647 RepID=UPI000225C05F|nr:type II toxin-antitoxin system RelE/ParE family toxin [Candidatus Odyssella thessalonicensis]